MIRTSLSPIIHLRMTENIAVVAGKKKNGNKIMVMILMKTISCIELTINKLNAINMTGILNKSHRILVNANLVAHSVIVYNPPISPLFCMNDNSPSCHLCNEGPLQGGSLSAKISQLYLLDLLYAEYFKRTNQESSINKEKTANAVIEKML